MLRDSTEDTGHAMFYLRRLTLPLKNDHGGHYNVSIRHFCGDQYDHKTHRARYFSPTSNIGHLTLWYWDDRGKQWERVPHFC